MNVLITGGRAGWTGSDGSVPRWESWLPRTRFCSISSTASSALPRTIGERWSHSGSRHPLMARFGELLREQRVFRTIVGLIQGDGSGARAQSLAELAPATAPTAPTVAGTYFQAEPHARRAAGRTGRGKFPASALAALGRLSRFGDGVT